MNATINKVKAIKDIKQPLDEKYDGKLELHIEAYSELKEEHIELLDAIVNNAPYIDDHSRNEEQTVNPYKHFALFKRGNKLSVCPIHATSVTCLNPLYMEDGVVHLHTWSVGGNITANQLKDCVTEGYLVGYVIKL